MFKFVFIIKISYIFNFCNEIRTLKYKLIKSFGLYFDTKIDTSDARIIDSKYCETLRKIPKNVTYRQENTQKLLGTNKGGDPTDYAYGISVYSVYVYT